MAFLYILLLQAAILTAGIYSLACCNFSREQRYRCSLQCSITQSCIDCFRSAQLSQLACSACLIRLLYLPLAELCNAKGNFIFPMCLSYRLYTLHHYRFPLEHMLLRVHVYSTLSAYKLLET